MESLQTILSVLALCGFAAIVIVGFVYRSIQKESIATLKNTNETLRESNQAYLERNDMLEKEIKRIKEQSQLQISELKGRIKTLERIKTPPFKPLMDMMRSNHKEFMKAVTNEQS